ncbi:MAG TPA: tripartite tricarboxylate transporter substrate-binding protein [Roseomonas sp.]|jgi:tripartite-type tricarboxylate transporter receptor subunit TctC
MQQFGSTGGPRGPRRRGILGAGLAAALAAPRIALGQPGGYPARPVRVVNAYSPGGPADVVCRIVFARLSQQMGQQFVIENRPGAAGTIAAGVVARAPGDGYTLLYDATAHTVNPAIFGARLPYDTRRDFLPVFLSMHVPNTLLAANSFAPQNVAELIALAKATPAGLDCSTTGVGTGPHISLELFNSLTGARLNHVVYRDMAAAQNDLLSGRVPLQFSNVLAAVPHLQAHTARVLAQCGPGPVAALPGVPSMSDTVPGFETYEWNGIFAPAHTPAEIVRRLNLGLNEAIRDPVTIQRLTEIGASTHANTPEEFAAFLDQQFALHARVVREAHITID